MGAWKCSYSRNYLGTACGQRPLVSSTYLLLVGLTNIRTESSIWWQNKHSQKLMTLAWWPGVFMKGSNWLEMTVDFLIRHCAPLRDGQTLTMFLLRWHTWYHCQFPFWAVYFFPNVVSPEKGHLPEAFMQDEGWPNWILPSRREFNQAPTQCL